MSRKTVVWSLVATAALGGCDRQVDTGYQGDSLLRVRGSVTIPQALEIDLVPALVLYAVLPGHEQPCCDQTLYDHLRLVDVGVHGEFPSNFTLDVYDPPPDEAVQAFQPGEPAYAVGYLTAAPIDHPDALLTTPWWDDDLMREWYEYEVEACGEDDPGCKVIQWCTLDGESCLRQVLSCPTGPGVQTDNDCELTRTEGDESLMLAGYAIDYRVVYFADDVDADTNLAAMFGNGDAMSAGYHLIHRVKLEEATSPAPMPCWAEAEDLAVERYNAQHETSFTRADLSKPWEERYYEYQRIFYRAMRELDCPIDPSNRNEDVVDQPVSIELGALGAQTAW